MGPPFAFCNKTILPKLPGVAGWRPLHTRCLPLWSPLGGALWLSLAEVQ